MKGAGDAETDFGEGVLGYAEGGHCRCGHGLRVCWHLAFVGVVRRDVTGNVTTYASQPGAVAAPTAGLHFTPQLLRQCSDRGVGRTELTLHVGPGTFRPVTTERLSEHRMHEEWCRLPETAAAAIREKSPAGRLVAVGTTSVRTLEAAVAATGAEFPAAWERRTALFIRPGYEFRAVQGLLTNFHLPGSTLLALVAAFAGFELVMDGYLRAREKQYRFYSYGDAMLIL
ncbi:MAG: S-adenosylmethionine:tRNA ribosyltransferase-isomerase [Planctomycetaceae bacterium]